MNNEEREFIVTKIEKYNEGIEFRRKMKNNYALTVVLSVIAEVLFMGLGINLFHIDAAFRDTFFTVVGLGGNSFLFISGLNGMIESIARKTGLENRVRELEEKLELDELNKNKGRGR